MEAKVRSASEQIQIFDRFRKKFILLTPEEWVRQHYVGHLVRAYAVPESLLLIESQIKYGTLNKRPDIVVMGLKNRPWLIVECKSTEVPLGPDVLHQVVTYASVLNPMYIGITNGLEHIYFEFQPELKNFVLVKDLPCYA